MPHSSSINAPSTAPNKTAPSGAPSRRTAILAGATLVLSPLAAANAACDDNNRLASVVAKLIARADQANTAFMQGDMRAWYRYAGPIPDDFTLMQPFGGPASHGFDPSAEHLDNLAGFFSGGQARLEVIASYASEALVVLVFVERQRGEVGDLPDQDWSLRVTQVYRRNNAKWELVHRHADPLVRPIGLKKTAALARGE